MASPATITIRVCTETDAGTESAAVTGIDLISADNATNSAPNRAAYPITAGTKSYEKWIRAYVDTAPDNYVQNFKLWGDVAVQESTHLYVGITDSGVTPTSADSSVATNAWTTYDNGTDDALAWHATAITATDGETDYAVFQLDVDADAAAGNWTQETISYSYDEA
jgi:hypothetical protein